ncbi:MAG TPA: DUF3570 domain-containing protein [Kofleriaceae bacterium]|nr:DUF3570 domain-containing protein [Kofleriaceae bacterium]
MQLARYLVAVAALAAAARADTGFTSKVQVYTDSDHTTVISPVVQAAADVTNDTSVSLGYLVDAVSSASVDIVSQASPREMHDVRHQVSTGLTHTIGTLTLDGNYSYSTENDYLSHTLGFGASKDFDDKNTTFALDYGVSLNTVGRSGDANFSRDETAQHVSLSWTQIINPKLATQLTYELGHDSGFQSSPYRYVPIRASATAAPELWVWETDPDERTRNALVFGINRALGKDSVQADYRLYLDDWGIASHTFGLRYFTWLTKHVELRLRERFYTQGAASFYQEIYTQPEKYITFDRELSTLWSETFGAKLVWGVADHVELELKTDVFYYSYAEFLPLQSRTGANLGIGMALTY